MTASTPVAVDEMMGRIKEALDAFPGLDVRWPGRTYPAPPAADARWARVSYTHDDGGQASLAGADGKKRHRRAGQLFVQCFAPVAEGSLKVAEEMACAVRDAFEGPSTASGVWFRRAQTNEVGASASWWQVNATAEFNYDEVK